MTVMHAQVSMAESVPRPWDDVSADISAVASLEEALKQAGIDWNTDRRMLSYASSVPVELQVPNVAYQVNAPSHVALVRSDNDQLLTVVPSDWPSMNNLDAFKLFQRINEAANAKLMYAGMFDESRIVWGLSKLPLSTSVIDGDVMDYYLLFTNPHIYGRSIELRLLPVRGVNQATINLALSKPDSIRLSGLDDASLAKAVTLINNQVMFHANAAKTLAESKADPIDVDVYLAKLFPNESIKNKGDLSRPAKDIKAIIDTQPGADYARGTWWQVYNAVIYSTDHVLGHTQESRLKSAWYGFNRDRKVKALDSALIYAGSE